MIKGMFWNVRGISKALTFRRLKKLIQMYSIQFLAICESRLQVGRAERYRCKLNFHGLLHNSVGSVLENYFDVIIGESSQHVSARLSHDHLPESQLVVSFVHTRCTTIEREELWAGLLSDSPASTAWLVGGDFNVISDADEKRGGRPFNPAKAMEFVQFISEVNLTDIGFSGARFTWCNNRHGGGEDLKTIRSGSSE
ncbi:uncharacterized protein [Coffea arabica]|uniref:Endonuclease/exonuclease/phosphatase domain-containing protein n=1 Tax=Coffea arabica TaxID=13443 RepID=A0ABM4WPH9_COFAR